MMSWKSPSSRYYEGMPLQTAMATYRDLGRKLSSSRAEQLRNIEGSLSIWREQAKEVRRLIEREYGGVVRSVGAIDYIGPKGEVIPADYKNRRDFFTLQKKAGGDQLTPRFILVETNERSGEPDRVLYARTKREIEKLIEVLRNARSS